MLKIEQQETLLLRTFSRTSEQVTFPKSLTPVLKVKQKSTKLIHSNKNLFSPAGLDCEFTISSAKLGNHGLLRKKTFLEQF